jgi:hypothetical protein
MAQRGVQYQNAFTTAPVCAPSRFALVTGMYAQMCGPAHDMRANGPLPENTKPLPLHMRAAGYYCTNNVFTDYNMAADQDALWDDCDIKAHWRNRPAGKPFFSVYNYLITHESHIFGHVDPKTDPSKVMVPPFMPDNSSIRSILARNIDMVNNQDAAVGHLLSELKEDGLADDTFVFFLADHGGVHPRSKRYCYDDGLHVPMIVLVPKHFEQLARDPLGKASKRLISHVDMAPTVLTLAGVTVPSNMVGTPFIGQGTATQPRRYAFSMRDRMDERYDLTYSVRDERFRYIRNYASQRIYAQHEAYEWQSEAYQAWERAHIANQLNEVQSRFWNPKPVEELYDMDTDPHSVRNLIDAPTHRGKVAEMRKALDEQIVLINDNGLIPEGVAFEGYDASRKAGIYPVREALRVASLGLQRNASNTPQFLAGLQHENECVRYWHAQGLLLVPKLPSDSLTKMEQRLATEQSVVVRCALAEALIAAGRLDAAQSALLDICSKQTNIRFQLRALNVLSTAPVDQLKEYRADIEKLTGSSDEYVPEAARYLIYRIDNTYKPDSKVFGVAARQPATEPNRPRKPMGDPQI